MQSSRRTTIATLLGCQLLAGACLVLTGASYLLAGSAEARRSESKVEQVERLYKNLYFDKARKVCASALAAGRNPRSLHLRLLRLKGLIAASTGHAALASATFKKLLSLDPGAALDAGHAPRIRKTFEQARAEIGTGGALGLVLRRAEPKRARIVLATENDKLSLVSSVVLRLRAASGRPFSKQRMRRAKSGATSLWSSDLSPWRSREAARFAYYAIAVDEAGNELMLLGSSEAPLSLTLASRADLVTPPPSPPPRASTSWYKTWWFWTAVGVAVVGAGVGIGFAVAQPADTVDATIQTGIGR